MDGLGQQRHRGRGIPAWARSADPDAAYVRMENTQSCPEDMAADWRAGRGHRAPTYHDFYVGRLGVCAGTCPTPGEGVVNGGQAFDGQGTGINVPVIPGDDAFNWGVGDGFSIEFWMKTDAASTCAVERRCICRPRRSRLTAALVGWVWRWGTGELLSDRPRRDCQVRSRGRRTSPTASGITLSPCAMWPTA